MSTTSELPEGFEPWRGTAADGPIYDVTLGMYIEVLLASGARLNGYRCSFDWTPGRATSIIAYRIIDPPVWRTKAMSATSEIVERLRNWITDYARGGSLRRDQEMAHEAADRLDELERENAALREALEPFANMNIVSFGQRTQGMGPYLTSVWFDGYSTPVEKHQRARAALEERKP